jgi:hypothetical protein
MDRMRFSDEIGGSRSVQEIDLFTFPIHVRKGCVDGDLPIDFFGLESPTVFPLSIVSVLCRSAGIKKALQERRLPGSAVPVTIRS